MHIAIVGVGALGTVYATRLSRVARVTLVVRDLARAPSRLLIERVAGRRREADRLDAPPVTTAIPADADVVLVAVRADQLSGALLEQLAHNSPTASCVVMLTPLLPAALARAHGALGERLVVAMPGVVAYEPDTHHQAIARRVRYWTPRATPTALDAPPAGDPRQTQVAELARVLSAAGIPSEVKAHVRTVNPATTIAFFPLLLALEAAGGSVARLVADDGLLRLTLAAVGESRALAKSVGDVAAFASLAMRFASPIAVRAGVRAVRALSPEAITFFEQHFGEKLCLQNRLFLDEIRALAEANGAAVGALRALAHRAQGSRTE